jgi:nucleotide-binding universal stress UspA family protein
VRTTRVTRVIVGVDGSLAGLRALRLAVAEARHRDAVLHAVRAWNFDPAWLGYPAEWSREIERETFEIIARAFDDAMGGEPKDIEVLMVTTNGSPGVALTRYACRDNDLLVVGSAQHGLLRRLITGSVSHYCAGHAVCPVLVVPADTFAKAAARTSLEKAIERDLTALTG